MARRRGFKKGHTLWKNSPYTHKHTKDNPHPLYGKPSLKKTQKNDRFGLNNLEPGDRLKFEPWSEELYHTLRVIINNKNRKTYKTVKHFSIRCPKDKDGEYSGIMYVTRDW